MSGEKERLRERGIEGRERLRERGNGLPDNKCDLLGKGWEFTIKH